MSTRATTRNYAGRHVDIELLQHMEQPLPVQRVWPDIVGKPEVDPGTGRTVTDLAPKIVSGIEKAVQRYAKLLLTNAGSSRLAPGAGNTLVRSVRAGQVSNLAYFGHLFALANITALSAIAEDDADAAFGSIPDDERIVSANLEDMELERATGTARLRIRITTAAGDDYTFIIPVEAGISR